MIPEYVEEHKHCKLCGRVIEIPNLLGANHDSIAYNHSVCVNCMVASYVISENKNKKENG